MNVLMLSTKLSPKRFTIALFVLTVVLIGTSMESNAQLFWRSRTATSAFNSNSFRTSQPVQTSNYRIPTPRTGYGSNLHRNFVIRQQQLRSQAGGSLIYRGNVLWNR